jgi:hypothetical protein
MSNLPEIRVKDNAVLPDNSQWKNRFHVKSESSNNLYVVAQRKSDDSWGCECPGWRTHRTCKHLKAMGLPGHCRPYPVTLIRQKAAN